MPRRGTLLRFGQLVEVALVKRDKAERVGRPQIRVRLAEGFGVEQREPLVGAHTHVVPALRADLHAIVQLLLIDELATRWALDPHVVWDLGALRLPARGEAGLSSPEKLFHRISLFP